MLSLFHISGPLHGWDLLVGISTPPECLRYTYVPSVGYLALRDGEVEYRLDRERSELTPHSIPGMEEGKAVYVCETP